LRDRVKKVVIVDYGIGNLLSACRAFQHIGARVDVSNDPKKILDADRLVLPGVGAFADGMESLRKSRLINPINEFVASHRPFLGICLGMQMMLSLSKEFGENKGLDLISGQVISIPPTAVNGDSQKIPHIGWSSLVLSRGVKSWEGGLLQGVKPGEAVYFVHSFMAVPRNQGHRIADCLYGDIPVSAVIGRDNIYGCQFHPEKSGKVGLKVLRRFLSL
jgi:imidazole glycerol-phosphate synthase subunit HisH